MVNLVRKVVRKDIVAFVVAAVVPTVPLDRIFVQNQEGQHGDIDKGPWVRIAVMHRDGSLTSIGGVGARRIEVIGNLIVQVFVEVGSEDKLTVIDDITDLVVNALEVNQTSSGIEFRNVVAREIGHDKVWVQMNVVADFNYEKLK